METFLYGVTAPLMILWAGIVGIGLLYAILIYLCKKHKYEKTEYFKQTHNPYSKVRNDLGLAGEYLVWKELSKSTNGAKFLFNCYLPKENGGTSEIDVIMLHNSGIYVFESKNYSGWIFGDQYRKTWTQSFRNHHKEHFYNPIMQNYNHIKYLQQYLTDPILAFHSVVVFSDRTKLKKVKFDSTQVTVVQHANIAERVQKIMNENQNALTDVEVEEMYSKLWSLTQVGDEEKMKHVERVKAGWDKMS